MKYSKETSDKMVSDYLAEIPVEDIAAELDVPVKSVIAKLSSLGVYKKKSYLNKRGEVPRKKEEYIESIAKLLDVNLELIGSLEKVNKIVLQMIEDALKDSRS